MFRSIIQNQNHLLAVHGVQKVTKWYVSFLSMGKLNQSPLKQDNNFRTSRSEQLDNSFRSDITTALPQLPHKMATALLLLPGLHTSTWFFLRWLWSFCIRSCFCFCLAFCRRRRCCLVFRQRDRLLAGLEGQALLAPEWENGKT